MFIILIIIIIIASISIYVAFFSKTAHDLEIEKQRLKQDIGFLILKLKTYAQKADQFDLGLIIKADHYLQKELKFFKLYKTSIGESLKSDKAKEFFNKQELDTLWGYRKLRNKIVHEDIIIKNNDIQIITKALEILKSKL